MTEEYFHETMGNLRGAWETELTEVYKQLNYRSTNTDLWDLQR